MTRVLPNTLRPTARFYYVHNRRTPVTEKELRKLNRYELLEMLLAQSKKLARVEQELALAKAELERRDIAVSSSGTLAEAALKLNRVFEDADRAAQQYIESAQAQERQAAQILEDAKKEAQDIIDTVWRCPPL